MQPTVPYLLDRFEHFNVLIFKGELPAVPIVLSRARTFLGKCEYKGRINALGQEEFFDFVIRISMAFDMSEDQLDDVLIHEMIHYCIAVNQLRDTSPHGKMFRQLMATINERFGRHITISNNQPVAKAPIQRKSWHVVAVVQMTDGKTGIKVLPRITNRITDYYNGVMSSPLSKSVKFYMSNDPFFNRYPNSGALKIYHVDPDELATHLHGSHDVLCDTNGNNVRVSPIVNK